MPSLARIPFSYGCLMHFISVTRSARFISCFVAPLPVMTISTYGSRESRSVFMSRVETRFCEWQNIISSRMITLYFLCAAAFAISLRTFLILVVTAFFVFGSLRDCLPHECSSAWRCISLNFSTAMRSPSCNDGGFRNWYMSTLFSLAAARIARPKAAVVLPFPFPVYICTSPFSIMGAYYRKRGCEGRKKGLLFIGLEDAGILRVVRSVVSKSK